MDKLKVTIFVYLLLATGICFYMFPSYDMIFYYYPWSLDLHLSYYEGPPMIAYVLRLMTTIFGHNIFAINFFGACIAGITCYVIIKLGEILENYQLGVIAALMWLVYPFATTHFVFLIMNYDCLDNLLTLLSILFILHYIQDNKIRYIYLTGATLGVLLLTKYTGVVLIMGIVLYFLIYSRRIFTNVHFYLAILLALIIFSPVVIWNYQHDWGSFHYKLTFHNWHNAQYKGSHHGISGVVFYLCSDILGVMHVMLLALVIVWFKNKNDKIIVNNNILFLWIICATYFIYWLIMSYSFHVAMNYMLPLDSILIILSCYYLYKYKYFKVIHVLQGLFLLISIVMLIDRAFIKVPEDAVVDHFRHIQTQLK